MRVLSLRGADVIGLARTLEAARTACAKIKGNTRPIACELTDLDSIAKCAGELSSSAPPLDMLICNAGMMLPKLEQIRGVEKQFATNHVGHFLLVGNFEESWRSRRRTPQRCNDSPPNRTQRESMSSSRCPRSFLCC
jgi:NAD(P)-dependent dehydrogenase (short-subunit alcohol dehydrogenase family)